MKKRYFGSNSPSEKYTDLQLVSLGQAINEAHNYTPEFKYYKTTDDTDDLLFGIELEYNVKQEEDNQRYISASKLLMSVNEDFQHFYCKRDGSLANGFEFNSMPMSLNYFKHLDGDKIQQAIRESKVYASDDCGFHVHMSRRAFTDESLSLFLDSMYNLLPLLLFLSKRKSMHQLVRYSILGSENFSELVKQIDGSFKAMKVIGTTTSPIIKEKSGYRLVMKNHEANGRYAWLSLAHTHTLEFRLFKGTTSWTFVINTLELLRHLYDLAMKGVSVTSMKHLLSTIPLNTSLFKFVSSNMKFLSMELKRIESRDKSNKVLTDNTDWDDIVGRSSSVYGDFILYRIPYSMLQVGDIVLSRNRIDDFTRRNRSDNNPNKLNDFLSSSGYRVVDILLKDSTKVYLCDQQDSSEPLIALSKDEKDQYQYFRRVLKILAPKLTVKRDVELFGKQVRKQMLEATRIGSTLANMTEQLLNMKMENIFSDDGRVIPFEGHRLGEVMLYASFESVRNRVVETSVGYTPSYILRMLVREIQNNGAFRESLGYSHFLPFPYQSVSGAKVEICIPLNPSSVRDVQRMITGSQNGNYPRILFNTFNYQVGQSVIVDEFMTPTGLNGAITVGATAGMFGHPVPIHPLMLYFMQPTSGGRYLLSYPNPLIHGYEKIELTLPKELAIQYIIACILESGSFFHTPTGYDDENYNLIKNFMVRFAMTSLYVTNVSGCMALAQRQTQEYTSRYTDIILDRIGEVDPRYNVGRNPVRPTRPRRLTGEIGVTGETGVSGGSFEQTLTLDELRQTSDRMRSIMQTSRPITGTTIVMTPEMLERYENPYTTNTIYNLGNDENDEN